MVGDNAVVKIIRNNYPPPPNAFISTEDVEQAHYRWRNLTSGKEPLQSMTYFLVTLLERRAGGDRTKATKIFKISKPVIKTLARLSSDKTHGLDSRKAAFTDSANEITDGEVNWLNVAIPKIIFRLGAHATGAQLTEITMTDLLSSGNTATSMALSRNVSAYRSSESPRSQSAISKDPPDLALPARLA
jgi:hypothetical protein